MEAPDEAEDKVGRHNENSHSPPKMTECYSLCRSYTVLAHLPSRTQVLGAVGGSAVSESSPPEGGPPPERAEEEEEETPSPAKKIRKLQNDKEEVCEYMQ